MADKPNLVHVEIFGQTYAVRAGTDPGYVEKLAAYVDSQMNEVEPRPAAPWTRCGSRCWPRSTSPTSSSGCASRAERAGDGSRARAAALAKELEAALGE